MLSSSKTFTDFCFKLGLGTAARGAGRRLCPQLLHAEEALPPPGHILEKGPPDIGHQPNLKDTF